MSLTKASYSMIQGAVVNVLDYGAVGDGTTDNSAAIRAASVAARTSQTDSTGRTISKAIYFPSGIYVINSAIELAPTNGLTGLTVFGDGSGATFINYKGSSTALSCQSSRAITFKDLGFTSSNIDDNQNAFNVVQTGNPLRSWRFERCDFAAFYTCFYVSGASMCSEFYFNECQFSQCYYLMLNNNDQAVNWNFVNCNWENEALSTTKQINSAAIFYLQKGTFVKWTGGSIVLNGLMAFYALTSSGVCQKTAHKICFDGVRIELVNNSGYHAPLMDKTTSGYVSGSNSPILSMSNFTILNRGGVPTSTIYFNVWSNCSLYLEYGECTSGIISGLLDNLTQSQCANVYVSDVNGISYSDNITNRLNDHDTSNVHIDPDLSSGSTAPLTDLRISSLSVPTTATSKRMYVRGPTGSLPQGGTTVNLPLLQDHFTLINIFCYRFTTAGQSLTINLKDQANTTVYGTLTIAAGVTNGLGYIGQEVGFQIPSGTALMLQFVGTAEVVKGVVGLEYL